MTKAKSNSLNSRSMLVFSVGVMCLIAAIALSAYAIFGIPNSKDLPGLKDNAQSAVNQPGMRSNEEFASMAKASQRLPFQPYVMGNPMTNGSPTYIVISQVDEKAPTRTAIIYSSYRNGSSGLGYTVSQSNGPGPHDNRSESVVMQFNGQTVTAYYRAPEKVEGKHIGGELVWSLGDKYFSIVDDVDEGRNITKEEFLKLAASLEPFSP